MKVSIIDEVIEQLKSMPQPLQWQVLEFAKKLVNSQIKVIPGNNYYILRVQLQQMIFR